MESTAFKNIPELVGDHVMKVTNDEIEQKEFAPIFEENKDSTEFYLLYFGAHWAPPCRLFLTTLEKWYNKVNDKSKRVEVIFVTAIQTITTVT